MIKYTIEKHNQLSKLNNRSVYILWGEVNSEHGFCVRGIYQGTKKECEEKLQDLKRGRKELKKIIEENSTKKKK